MWYPISKSMYKLYIQKNITSKDMLNKCLLDYAGMQNYTLKYNSYGKPYLVNCNIFFNISNCQDVCVLAVSNKPIGVDIQFYTYKENLHHTFSDKELDLLNSSQNKEVLFTKMWVVKEAYVKMLGVGLSYGLANVDYFKVKKRAKIIKKAKYVICVIEGEVDEVLI